MSGGRPSLLILLPDGHIHKLVLPFLKTSFREAPLTATMLAALFATDYKSIILRNDRP